jgi:sugar O-acyltransferase (sialic acid O-acetyltransferase NeuD family)
MESILIFGAGGHAKVVCDIVEKEKRYLVAGFVDSHTKEKEFLGYPVLSNSDDVSKLEFRKGIIAVGDGWLRKSISENILKFVPKFEFVSAIHPSAQISRGVRIGGGTAVMANASINTDSKIGKHCLVNTNASVDHDNRWSDFCGVGPGAHLGGNIAINEGAYVAIGATVIQGIQLGKWSLVGAGSVVLENVADEVVAFGVPCKVQGKRDFQKRYF